MSNAGNSPWREMAEKSTILRCVSGSTAHGLNLPGTDDRDELGICIESPEAALGFTEFEQFEHRTASEREGKHDAPSQPGDLDLTIYSLRKFLRLALQGNPSVLNLLFIRPENCMVQTFRGAELQALAPSIISRQAGKRYLGYMESQRQRLLGERGQKKVNRPELEEKYGYDTKYAGHIIRLGLQGVELLSTGKITLPMAQPERSKVLAIRRGETDLTDVLNWCGQLEREVKDLLTTSPLPEYPDQERVEAWMVGAYLSKWGA